MASLDMAPHDSLIELASLPMHLKSDSQLMSKWAIYMYNVHVHVYSSGQYIVDILFPILRLLNGEKTRTKR